MSSIIHFGTEGWRARVDEDFTRDNLVRVADAVARVWARRSPGAIVYVGYDTRPHAEGLAAGYDGHLTLEGAKKYCPPNWAYWYLTVLSCMEQI